MAGSYMACAWDLKQTKDWLAQSVFPCVACTSHIFHHHTRNVNLGQFHCVRCSLPATTCQQQ